MAKRQIDESFMKEVISGGLPYKPERKGRKPDVEIADDFDSDTFDNEPETALNAQEDTSEQLRLIRKVPLVKVDKSTDQPETANETVASKDSRMTFEEYEERFLANVRTPAKASFMIDRNIVMMIKKIIYETESNVSVASYIHNILVFHFEEFRDIINKTTHKIKKPTIPQKL